MVAEHWADLDPGSRFGATCIGHSSDTEDECECLVDCLQLIGVKPAGRTPEALGIDSSGLLDEYAGLLPSSSIAGRNVAGRALVEVGETRVVLKAENSSACAITAERVTATLPRSTRLHR